MTRIVILLPGIMGSRLSLNGTEIWPPTLGEVIAGYSRINKLLDPAAKPTDVIREVTSCYPVYKSLIDQLASWGYREGGIGARGKLVCWPYDWRIDNRTNAYLLSQTLQNLLNQHEVGTELILLPHSMGGLIARYALEVNDPKLGDTSWRAKCKLLITLATPHRGAPVALIRALGIEGDLGVSGPDIGKFASDPNYAAAYQLLPSREAKAFWKSFGSEPFDPVDVLEPAIAGGLGLNPTNIAAANAFHAALARGEKPAGCRYFFFIGHSAETVVRCDLGAVAPGSVSANKKDHAGDGTVPFWSGTFADEQVEYEGDDHARTFRSAGLLATLRPLLGVPPSILAAAAPDLSVHLSKPVYTTSDRKTARIKVNAENISDLQLELVQLGSDGSEQATASILDIQSSNTFNREISVDLPPDLRPGLYGLRAKSGTSESDLEPFAIQR